VTTFQPGSSRETLAPLGAAALENRATAAGRHPRAESVPALPASNVRLESAFQERCEKKMCGMRAGPCRPPGQYREAGLPPGDPAEPCGSSGDPRRSCSKPPERSISKNLRSWKSTGGKPHGHRPHTTFPQLWRLLWKGRNCLLRPRFLPLRPACFQALRGLGGVAMIAASRSLAEGAISRRATPC
jgi:hypothetical protein